MSKRIRSSGNDEITIKISTCTKTWSRMKTRFDIIHHAFLWIVACWTAFLHILVLEKYVDYHNKFYSYQYRRQSVHLFWNVSYSHSPSFKVAPYRGFITILSGIEAHTHYRSFSRDQNSSVSFHKLTNIPYPSTFSLKKHPAS